MLDTSSVPGQGRGPQLFLVTVVMVAIAFTFVVARLAYRLTTRRFGWDDGTIALSLTFSVLLSTFLCIAVSHGYGQHKVLLTHSAVQESLRWYYYAQIVYKIEICLTKSSILFSYLRIFPVSRIQIASYSLLAIIIPWSIGSIVATICQCLPIQGVWIKSTPNAVCIDSDAFWEAYGIINILTDVAILALPIWTVAKLRLPIRDRVGLIFAFTLGGFVTLTSILRVVAVKASEANKADITWAFVPRGVWTLIEANVGIICACLPALRKPLFSLVSAATGESSRRGYSQYSSSSRRPSESWSVHGISPLRRARLRRAPPTDEEMTGIRKDQEVIVQRESIELVPRKESQASSNSQFSYSCDVTKTDSPLADSLFAFDAAYKIPR